MTSNALKKRNENKFSSLNIIKILVFLMPLFFIFRIEYCLDSDTYWIIKTGEYISNFGIPTKDFLTFHTNMDLVVQQWLSSVIFYKIYHIFGTAGLMGLVYIFYLLIFFLQYKLAKKINKSKGVSILAVSISSFFFSEYAVTRPQMITYILVLAEILLLENYVQKKDWKFLIPLPIISVLSVNLHCSMWTMLFILLLPYMANALPIKIKGKNISSSKLLPLIIAFIFMVLFGFITPYGVKGMTFIFNASVGNKVNSVITELQRMTFSKDNFTDILLIAFSILIYIAFHKKIKKVPLRFHLLALGTLLMGMLYLKLFVYFILIGIPAVSALLIDYKFKIREKFKDRKFSKVIGSEIIILLVFILSFSTITSVIPMEFNKNSRATITYTNEFNEAVKYLDKEDKNSMVLFNGFNCGGHLEFNGYKTYIDPRADSFIIECNHDFDYLNEYIEVKNGTIDFNKFINKYQFTDFFIENDVETKLLEFLEKNKNYKVLFKNEKFTVIKKLN